MRTVLSRSTALGFTLVEFMVTVTVLVVLLAVAGPPMVEFTANNHLVTTKSILASSIALTRTEAARLGQMVIIKAASGGVAGNEYKAGWEIYLDSDGDLDVSAGDTLLRRFDAPSESVKLGGISPLKFQPTGYLVGGATLNFTICRASGSNAGYQVSVTPSGIADVSSITSC